jgi:hypothetical protein
MRGIHTSRQGLICDLIVVCLCSTCLCGVVVAWFLLSGHSMCGLDKHTGSMRMMVERDMTGRWIHTWEGEGQKETGVQTYVFQQTSCVVLHTGLCH